MSLNAWAAFEKVSPAAALVQGSSSLLAFLMYSLVKTALGVAGSLDGSSASSAIFRSLSTARLFFCSGVSATFFFGAGFFAAAFFLGLADAFGFFAADLVAVSFLVVFVPVPAAAKPRRRMREPEGTALLLATAVARTTGTREARRRSLSTARAPLTRARRAVAKPIVDHMMLNEQL